MVSGRETVKSSYRGSGSLRLSGRKKVIPAPTAEALYVVAATHVGEGEDSEQTFSPLLLTHLMESHACRVLPLLGEAQTRKTCNSSYVPSKERGWLRIRFNINSLHILFAALDTKA